MAAAVASGCLHTRINPYSNLPIGGDFLITNRPLLMTFGKPYQNGNNNRLTFKDSIDRSIFPFLPVSVDLSRKRLDLLLATAPSRPTITRN